MSRSTNLSGDDRKDLLKVFHDIEPKGPGGTDGSFTMLYVPGTRSRSSQWQENPILWIDFPYCTFEQHRPHLSRMGPDRLTRPGTRKRTPIARREPDAEQPIVETYHGKLPSQAPKLWVLIVHQSKIDFRLISLDNAKGFQAFSLLVVG